MAKKKCQAMWGTRWCVLCGRFIKRRDQNCIASLALLTCVCLLLVTPASAACDYRPVMGGWIKRCDGTSGSKLTAASNRAFYRWVMSQPPRPMRQFFYFD
jgi:hypothetical protein